ncbi:MAG TPA: GTPase Era [Steroidobacteraceae bacterium]|jgi:GTP-binding protein Era|nr:GTPase Era [Steroidobacteraceae bacterium]
MSAFRSGFVALAGRPNVGKSTLLNALVGQKLSIVTPRPQTTRHRVIGLVNLPDAQIAFVDTPGLHRGHARALNRAMNRTAAAAVGESDLVLFVVEAMRWTDEDAMALERIATGSQPIVAIVNKVDRVHPRERLLPYLGEFSQRHTFADIVPISASKSDNLEALRRVIVGLLPEGQAMFPVEQVTDRSVNFRIAELIREKLTLELVEELPYGVAVEIEQIETEEDGRKAVSAVIWVDRAGQKPIVIGAGGERLKRVGRAARLELNHVLGERFHLTLWVKVREDWADDARALKHLGLE